MATERVNDLRAFKGFIEEKLSNGGAELTLEQALVDWELENQTDEEREATVQAIRNGLADVDAGRTRPFADFDREVSARHSQSCHPRYPPELVLPSNQGASSWHVREILIGNTTGGSITSASAPADYQLATTARASAFRPLRFTLGGSGSLHRCRPFLSLPCSFPSPFPQPLVQRAHSRATESRSNFRTTSGFAWTRFPSPSGFAASPPD
jgi:hypothetical protein